MKQRLPSFPKRLFLAVWVAMLAVPTAWLVSLLLSGRLHGARASAGQTAARPSSKAAAAASAKAEQLLADARQKLESHDSLTASIHFRLDIYGQALAGNGVYRQGSQSRRWLQLELKIKQNDLEHSLQQRCDGEQLWIYRQEGDVVSIGRVDVERVLAAHERRAARASLPMLGLGGLPRLLRSLAGWFRFTSANEARLDNQPVHVLRGEWQPHALAHWLPDQKAAIEAGEGVDYSKLPAPLPDQVYLYLGKDDLFPYRIEYRRGNSAGEKNDGGRSKTLVQIDFGRVDYNAPLDPRNFQFDPGSDPVSDETELYIGSLGLAPSAD